MINMLLYETLAYTIHRKKSNAKTKNLKYQLQREMRNLNYLMNHISHQIFKITLGISSKIMRQ